MQPATLSSPAHVPVLLNETLQALALQPDDCVVDATFGRGGHSRAALAQLGAAGRLVVWDRDPAAIAAALALQQQDQRVTVIHDGFSSLASHLQTLGLHGRVQALMMDLGVSSPQLDTPERGFSFRFDGPLDMRMNPSEGTLTAAQWLASAGVDEIVEVIKTYGEERFAVPIAQAIVARCAEAREGRAQALGTTRQLADLVAGVVRRRQGRAERGQDPATRTFQAIRIHINRELEELQAALRQVAEVLADGGRLAVISFHSLEDRIVKRSLKGDGDLTIRTHAAQDARLRYLPSVPSAPAPAQIWSQVRRVKPSEAEAESNPRARSAVLRVAVRAPRAEPVTEGVS